MTPLACRQSKRLKNTGFLPQYYAKGTHEGIISPELWECVQLEIARQKVFCVAHYMPKYHIDNTTGSLAGKLVCGTCGRPFQLLASNRIADMGRKYWRCTSFRGRKAIEINGRTVKVKPRRPWREDDGSATYRYVSKRRKPVVFRPMLCTDIEIDTGVPERVFVEVWNRLADDPPFELNEQAENKLLAYRRRELLRLLEETVRFGILQTN